MDKFEEFQTTMAKSNELFTTFRQEMEKVFVCFLVNWNIKGILWALYYYLEWVYIVDTVFYISFQIEGYI